jgi:hypothetical protein
MADTTKTELDPGRLELVLDEAVLRGDDDRYTFTLCDYVLFTADTARAIPGIHTLETPFVLGAGNHLLTVAAEASTTGEQVEEAYPIEIPERMKAYAIGIVECRVERDRGRQAEQERRSEESVGLQLTETEEPGGQRMSASALGGGVSCCSTKA